MTFSAHRLAHGQASNIFLAHITSIHVFKDILYRYRYITLNTLGYTKSCVKIEFDFVPGFWHH